MKESVKWYAGISIDLMEDFEVKIELLLNRIQTSPYQFPQVYKSVHRALVKRFPYAIFFQKYETKIVIVVITHTHRNPYRLKKRLGIE